MVLILVILVLLGTTVAFHLKYSMIQSLTMVWAAIFSLIITFTYYEFLANLLISRAVLVPWAQCMAFMTVYIIAVAILQVASESLASSKIVLGPGISSPVRVVCGLLTGLIFSGVLLIVLSLMPMQGKFAYSRFGADGSLVIANPKKPAVNADGFVAGLYGLVSRGSLSSDKSFGVLHADYLTQTHLNKLKAKDKVLAVGSRESLVLPAGKSKKAVRLWDIPGTGPLTVVRAGIVHKTIDKGGAVGPESELTFFPAQIRLITQKAGTGNSPLSGAAEALDPTGFIQGGSLAKTDLDAVKAVKSSEVKSGVYWFDVAFEVPSGQIPVLLEFKQNAIADLTAHPAVKTSPEIENALNAEDKEDSP